MVVNNAKGNHPQAASKLTKAEENFIFYHIRTTARWQLESQGCVLKLLSKYYFPQIIINNNYKYKLQIKITNNNYL